MIGLICSHVDYLDNNNKVMHEGGKYTIFATSAGITMPNEELKDQFCKDFDDLMSKYAQMEGVEV